MWTADNADTAAPFAKEMVDGLEKRPTAVHIICRMRFQRAGTLLNRDPCRPCWTGGPYSQGSRRNPSSSLSSPKGQQVYQGPQYEFGAREQRPPREPVNVQPAQFQSFEEDRILIDKQNISLIMDVPLQVTVELGRTQRLIRDILELSPGSIIELDKLAGEPVDILVNGKQIAKGEVVVIDESFGVRITDIADPSKRL